ncbi:pseudouridine synthase [Sphingobacteriaceae bacterium WQ 2009]|uniref:Pseudouridine synthase n=1 Tax=Rhinopithecimicrobium faecis TaxID=2820698 RepID=A0A8T4HCN2_9SPHI|nr:pseudouridine synthase [Sphingobacteriaceae bacterium WQ 2009]
MPFSNKRNSREDNSKKSRSNSENFKSKSGRSRTERPSKFNDNKSSSSRTYGKPSGDAGSDTRNKYDKPFGAPKRSFDDSKGPKKFEKSNFSSNEGPKRSFDRNEGPKRSFDRNEGPKRSFDRNEGPKRSFDRNEGPKRSFDRNEGPKRSFDRNEGPKRSFDRNEGPKRSFDRNEGPKRSFDRNEGPKRSFDRNEGPKRSFDRNEGPKRSFDRNEGPKRSFDRNEGPKRSFDRNEEASFERKSFDNSRSSKKYDRPNTGSSDSKGDFVENNGPKRYERKDMPSFDNRDKSYKTSYKKFDSNSSDRKPFHNKKDFSTPKVGTEDDGLIRLNRYISNSGVCSRRKADELIFEGLVSVNGEVVTELGVRVDPAKDEIRYNGERLKREKMVYVLLNKPKDYITTTDDPQERKTVMELVSKATKERIYPVGRLDRNTTGLLLLTNDGNLAEKLSHPRNSISKIYNVELDRALTQGDFNKIEYGIELEDGLIKPDDLSYVQGASKKEIGIQIHSGKNRIVRRIFESLGYEVVKLDRVVYANLTKKDLTRGRWRYIEERELIQLKHLI